MSHRFGQFEDLSGGLIKTPLQSGVEARKACYQEVIVRRKFVHHDKWEQEAGWRGPARDGKYNYPTECDIYRYQKPPAAACSAIHHDPTDPPNLKDDLKGHGKFYGLARLELTRRFPERAAKIFNWEQVGNNKAEYWNGAIGDLKELDLLETNADFGLNILVRLIYLYGALPHGMSAPWLDRSRIKWDGARWTIPADPNFDAGVQARIKQALLRFKYWLDDDFKVIEESKIWQARKGKIEESKASVVDGILGGVGGSAAGGLVVGPAGVIGGGIAGAVFGSRPSDPYADEKYEMEFFSENHQILFAAAEYLVGQLYPDEIFRPGENHRSKPKEQYRDLTGRQHMAKARKRLDDWLDDRLRFGLSECNAPGYYDEHFLALLNLADFALDESVRQRACMALDLLVFDLARFTHQGSFCVAAARAHFKHKNNGWGQTVGDLIEIIFGARGGVYVSPDALSACAFASTRRYQVPDALISIGRDQPAQMIDRSRASIDFNEASEYGIGFDEEVDVLRWWSRAAWLTKHVIDGTRKLVKKYGLEKTGVFKEALPALGTGADVLTGAKILGYVAAGPLFPLAIPLLGNPFSQTDEMADALSIVTEGSAYTRANLYTYRSRDVMLSSTQNHHSGQLSFQGNTCQATLSMCATVFTSHPSAGGGIDQSIPRTLGKIGGGLGGGLAGGILGLTLGGPLGLAGAVFGAKKGGEALGKALDKDIHLIPPSDDGPDWWTGNVTQPRVVQIKNAAILAYKPKAFQLLLFGHRFHAWFPQDAFNDLPPGIKGKPPGTTEERKQRSEKYFPLRSSLNCNVATGRWVFGRVGKGYIGLFSAQLPEWTNDGLYACHEIMVEADRNIFIIQVGDEQEFGSYEQFKDRVLRARIHINGLNWKLADFQCSYDAPGGKRLELHYDEDKVRYAGFEFLDNEFPRYDNPYAQVAWQQNKYVIQHKGRSLTHDIRRRQRREAGAITELVHEGDLRIYAQNTGLFPKDLLGLPVTIFPLYKGTERDRALQKLIDVLRWEKFDIVGLSEMWQESDRKRIRGALGDVYGYSLQGPDEADLERFDGGLMLLSRHKIISSNSTIYRQCVGEDRFANKGALHARIQVQGLPCPIDVFLTHTQGPEPMIGSDSDARQAIRDQIRHLAAFVQSCRDTRVPALLMGDLNVDGINDVDGYNFLVGQLRDATDLKPIFSPAMQSGKRFEATSENEKNRVSSFNEGNDPRPVIHDSRFGNGAQRLDYFFSWPGTIFNPDYPSGDRRVVIHQSSKDRDMSDHYGIEAWLATIDQKLVVAPINISTIRVRLVRFWCLQTTSGPGDDEVEFTLRCVPDRGDEKSADSPTFEDVSKGTERLINSVQVDIGDPGEFLIIAVGGKEKDDFSADDSLGTSSLWLTRNELLHSFGQTVRRMLPRLTDDGGEYAVEIEIEVD
jgi:endonuclease/exonuclease/phosphatase family metal-dependent hydrolase